MSLDRGGNYRTSAAPNALESTCLLCGNEGEADKTCATCAVPMPRITCGCGVVNSVNALRCRQCTAPLDVGEKRPRGCPRCSTFLTEIGVDPSAGVHACVGCRGLFVPARAWHVLAAREDLVMALAARLPGSVVAAPPTRLYECPECSIEMERMRFAATSQIVIDACTRQHGSWLDAGELAPALAYAKHRRAIGAEAALREAEEIERAKPGGDRNRLNHELALKLARERQERAAMAAFAAPAAPESKKRFQLLGILVVIIVFYVAVFAKDCSKRKRQNHSDAPDTDVKAVQ